MPFNIVSYNSKTWTIKTHLCSTDALIIGPTLCSKYSFMVSHCVRNQYGINE